MKNKRILFVDDEPKILQGLKRMLRAMHKSWEMKFAGSGDEALRLLSETPFDIIVTDMRMPGMDGLELLEQVKAAYPHMARVILSGHSDRQQILKSARIAHQFLAKPCDMDTLKSCIHNISAIQNDLGTTPVKELVSNITTLASPPSTYNAVMAEVKSPTSSMKRVGEIIEKDLAMTTKILQLVNSAFFGLPRKIYKPYDAACLLGIDIIRSLVLALGVFSQLKKEGVDLPFLDKLFHHGLLTASHANKIALTESMKKETADTIFMAGLLHDIGKLVLAQNFPRNYISLLKTAAQEQTNLSNTEKQLFKASHTEVGGYLLGLWGFSSETVNAVLFHHNPDRFQEITCGAVYAANLFAHNCNTIHKKSTILPDHDKAVLIRQGLLQRFDDWRALCCNTGSPPIKCKSKAGHKKNAGKNTLCR